MFIAPFTLALCAGFLLDLLLGDPRGWPHVVRGIGRLISALEKALYPMRNKRLGGLLLVFFALLVCTVLPGALLALLWRLSPWAYFAAEALLCWQVLALKSLKDESREVYGALAGGDLPAARRAVSMIVGRDTAPLDAAGVARAAVETVAENASDGVIAPLVYLALGGAVFGTFYKAVNTMDSMIGYKNERYIDFGRAAAKLDDAMNFFPSRLSALTMIGAARLCGLDAKGARRIWRRDRLNHASPNSAQTESVMAGALGVRLAGDAYYFGKLHEKPCIGDDLRPIEPEDILRSHRLLNAAAALVFVLALILRGCLYAAL
ncbi:adenosylcobinamide-phosphate synthase CbiB [Bacillota bacterium Meth-B3]